MNWKSAVVVQTFKKEARYPGSYPLFRQVLTNIMIIINEPHLHTWLGGKHYEESAATSPSIFMTVSTGMSQQENQVGID